MDTWDYARSYDGFSLDELYVDDTNAESLATAQAVSMVPQEWGPNYTLAVWCDGFASSTATSVNALRSANAPILMEDYWGDYSLHVGLVWWIAGIVLAIGYFIFLYTAFRGKVKDYGTVGRE